MPAPAGGDALRLTIVALGAAGDGVARLPDGTPCFVPRGLPGEEVVARAVGRRGDGLLAETEALLHASPDRVAPPCTHFDACGGCALQHWADARYAEWKRAKLAEALARAGFPATPVGPLGRTAARTRRRADLAVRRRANGVAIGFHARGDRAVVDLRACEVLDPRLVALFAPLRDLLGGLPALRREGSAVLNLLDTGPDLLLRTDGTLDAAGRSRLAAFGAAHGVPRVAWARGNGAAETAAQHGPALIRFGEDAVVHPPPGAFLQASPAGESAIRAAVLAGLPERLPARAVVAELYAGIGTLSFALARRARVAAFDGSDEAIVALAAAAGRVGARIDAARRDLARRPLLPAELKPYAAVVLDPPFGGAPEQVPLLARARVPRIIYVSCNPAALARDAGTLREAGYRVLSAMPVDQFLWSPHLESVVVFSV